ncbi:HAMP domain-containing histidine kinase [bacterium]|nr:HAMP domain-containing histidine kinase [bacterium]
MTAKGQAPATISLLAAPPAIWNDDLVSYLEAQGYRLQHIITDDEKLAAIQGPYPDVFMGQSAALIQAIFRQISDQHPDGARPLFILIDASYNGPLPVDWADLVLPPTAPYIDAQLRTVLRLRAENAALRSANQHLRDEVTAASERLELWKRDSDHLEVLKNAIVYNVAHELGTPLLQVKSAVSLLAEDTGGGKLATYATDATARLEMVVRNITLLGKAMNPNIGPVILRDTIASAQRNLKRVWLHKDDMARITLHIPEDLPPVFADKQGLSIVLELLLNNGLKFSDKTPVELSATREANQVILRVRDHGIGIEKDKLDHIFDTFYQVQSTSTRQYGGAGVGLAIVRLILERNGSSIHVESEPGIGSTFWFTLDVADLS